jgi:hypothetical protein
MLIRPLQYKVAPGQEESIAEQALVGGRSHPEFKAGTMDLRLRDEKLITNI